MLDSPSCVILCILSNTRHTRPRNALTVRRVGSPHPTRGGRAQETDAADDEQSGDRPEHLRERRRPGAHEAQRGDEEGDVGGERAEAPPAPRAERAQVERGDE